MTKPKAPPVVVDPTLSQDLLAAFCRRIPALSGRDQDNLELFLKGAVDASYATQALTLLWADSTITVRLQKASGSKKLDIAPMSASLFVWSLNQPWAQGITTDRLLGKWLNTCIKKSAFEGFKYVPNACAFLDDFVPLIPSIPEARRAPFVAAVYNALSWLTCPPSLERIAQRPLMWSLARSMGKMAAMCPNEISNNGLPLPEQWVRNTQETFNAKKAVEQIQMSVDLLLSDVSDDLKTRVLKQSPGVVWCRPEVAALIMPTLPGDEVARFVHLPWETDATRLSASAEANRAVLHRYCPTIAPIAELAAVDGDWLSKDFMARVVASFQPGNVPVMDQMPLPHDMDVP